MIHDQRNGFPRIRAFSGVYLNNFLNLSLAGQLLYQGQGKKSLHYAYPTGLMEL